MALSPNGKFLALLSESRRLLVISTDFQKSFVDFKPPDGDLIQGLSWCGQDAVVLFWPKNILVVGPLGEWFKYSLFDDHVQLVSEVDGIRIISASKHEFLQKVPESTESIFRIGSTSPAALLYDAWEHFERKSPKANENIRTIRLSLTDAVDECIDAAANEFHVLTQKALLKAASFGKSFLEVYHAEHFLEICKVIRVLNTMRHFEIGMPLSYSQYV